MHIAGPIVLLSALTSVNALVIVRDAKAILDVFSAVQTDIDGLDGAIKGWAGDPAPVLDASNKLVATIKDGTGKIQGNPDLSLGDAISLLKPTDELKKHARTLVDDLKAKKDVVVQGGLCDAVRGEVENINTESKAMIDATVSKVPEGARGIAEKQAQGFIDILNDAKESFSEANCVNA